MARKGSLSSSPSEFYHYIYKLTRGDTVIRGTGEEVAKAIGGTNRGLIQMYHVKKYRREPVMYRGYLVERTHKVVPTVVYEIRQGTGEPTYGTAKQICYKFGIHLNTLYLHSKDGKPILRRGKYYTIKPYGVKDVWKPLKSKSI